MVSIAQAQAQVKSAREELKGATTQAQKRQAEIKLAKAESQERLQKQTRIGTISQQVAFAQQVGRGGVREEIKRRRKIARKEFRETGIRISEASGELKAFETQLTGREAEIRGVESQISKAAEQEKIQKELAADITAANEAFRRGSLKPGASKRTVNLFKALVAKARLQPTTTELRLGMSLPLDIRRLPPSEIIAGQSFFGGQTLAPQIQPIQPLTVEAVEQLPFGRGGLTQRLQAFIGETEVKGLRGDITIPRRVLGSGAAFVSVFAEAPRRFFELGKGLVTEPIQTIKELPGGFRERAVDIASRIRGGTPEIGLGLLAGEVALFKGLGKAPKFAVKTTDIFRTARLTELPVGQVVAPEFFAGQVFPKIRVGQTAGELLGEFKPILPGELKPAGFTAAPKPFASETFAKAGTSELPGVFQAPLLSPRFLRISSEEARFFGVSPFETFRPSIVRITPEEIRLAAGVEPTQRVLQPVREVREFFKTAPKGVSIVPFIKTEKEAVIPFGTQLQLTQQRFFIKFEGRRIPIFEFEARGIGRTEARVLPTIEDISSSISSRRIGGRARVTPFDIGLSSRVLERFSSRQFLPSSKAFKSPVSRKGVPSSFRFQPPSSRIITPPPSRRGIPSVSEIGGLAPFEFRFEGRPFTRPPLKRIGTARAKEKRKPKRRPGFDFRLAPSFTAIVADLRALDLPKELSIGGISPRVLRAIPTRRKKK